MNETKHLIQKIRDDEYIPVVISEVVPSSHVVIMKLPLQTLNTNSYFIYLIALPEPVQLLPQHTYVETLSRTISNRKEIKSRQTLVVESESVRRNNRYRQFLQQAESEILIQTLQ